MRYPLLRAAPGEDEVGSIGGQEAKKDPPHRQLAQLESPPHMQQFGDNIQDRPGREREAQDEHWLRLDAVAQHCPEECRPATNEPLTAQEMPTMGAERR